MQLSRCANTDGPVLQEAEQEFVAKVEAALQNNEVDEDRIIEEQRRRRQKIMAKHQEQQSTAGAHLLTMLASYLSPLCHVTMLGALKPSLGAG